MARLDIERQERLEPERMKIAKTALTSLGYEITQETKTWLTFTYKNCLVKFFPYSGWHTGKTIQDGRGLQNLLKQLK